MASVQAQPKLTFQRRRLSVQFFVEQLANDIGIEMMQIPAGRFLMGSPEDELGRRSNEEPQHEVTVARFFMGKYPVTQVQWRVVANLPQVSRELAPDPSGFKGDKRPVESVSWYDAVEFCERLSAYTGREYRLPSEAEWEYACRASPMPTSATPASGEVRSANPIFRAGISKAGEAVGNNTPQPFHFGKTITTDVANYRGTDDEKYKWSGSYGEGPKGEYRQETTPVDHFKIANAFGLCDMHGNVWEWCADHWHDSYEGAPTDSSAWLSETEKANRLLRGGSWYSPPRHCRSAYRDDHTPDYRNDNVGFRVICSAP